MAVLPGSLLSLLVMVGSAAAVDAPPRPAEVSLRVRNSPATGVARFVTARGGGAIIAAPVTGKPRIEPLDFFQLHGPVFGVRDAARQLRLTRSDLDAIGQTHTTFQQVHEGIPVFGGVLRVHANAQGQITSANGTFVPNITLNPTPTLAAERAESIAITRVTKQKENARGLRAVNNTLYVYRTNLARGLPGTNHLVFEVEVGNELDVREFVYVDAHRGFVVDQITGLHDAIDRRVYNGGFDVGFLVWSEGDSTPFGDIDIDHLIDYTLDTYNLVSSMTGGMFLSWDGADATMHAVNNDPNISCPNAQWTGSHTRFCAGVTSDDVVSHEWGHAYTQSTHNLIYQWQSGALNESYSDIYGEVADFLNGAGTDAPIPLRTVGECSTLGSNPAPSFQVNAPAGIAGPYPIGGAAFNPAPPFNVSGDVELVNDGDNEGGAASVTDACQSLVGFTAGRIALIDRGTCPFVTKVNNAADAGAVGVIVINNQGDDLLTMSGTGPLAIPAVFIGQTIGNSIRNALPGVNATMSLDAATETSYRWLVGEDSTSFGGAIRDMWNPNCFNDPGKVSDDLQYFCGESDGGGVHTNSGVPNHCFALMVDGGTYNGQTVAGIGLTKAFHIYWRAQSVYQGPASDFSDHSDALEQSCADLIGANLSALSTNTPMGVPSGQIITAADCVEVADAIAAVELRSPPSQCNFQPLLSPNAPARCTGMGFPLDFFTEDWESGLGSWSVGTRAVANPGTFDTPDWAIVGALPSGRPGAAAFVADLAIGDCGADTEAGVLFLESDPIVIPPGVLLPRMTFDHWVATEGGWDGGNLKISVNNGPFTLIPSSAFTFNAYPATLNISDDPLSGEEAFTGADGGSFEGSWGQSQLDLAGTVAPGDEIVLRFEFGLDGCNGLVGWYIDDLSLYSCVPCSDQDGDGFGSPGDPSCSGGAATDCNDADPDIFPGGVEIPDDDIDQDCNGFDTVTCYADADGDSFGSTTTQLSVDGDCADAGESGVDTDCNDSNPSIFPGATEIADDDVDQDCNGFDTVTCFADDDGDGFAGSGTILSPDGDCTDPGEFSVSTDCDDGNNAIFPGAAEVPCNAIDENCNGPADDDADNDDDGVSACGGDCDDNDPDNYPGNNEVCDGLDNNCDLQADEGCALYADLVAPFCAVDVDDILYVLDAFADANPQVNFPGSDLLPCGGGPEYLVDVDDILAVLDAFSGLFSCLSPCAP